MESFSLCGSACVACMWTALGSFCVPRACTRMEEMKSMQFVPSSCSATRSRRHHNDYRGSCRILKPGPRAASRRGCFVPSTDKDRLPSADKDRLPIQPKPATPAPREQQTICVNRPKEKTDPTQGEMPPPQSGGIDTCPMLPAPSAPDADFVAVPPPKPPRLGLYKPSPADGTKEEPDRNGRATVGEPVRPNVATRPREDSGSVYEMARETFSDSDSDSDSVYESARGSDAESVYESARGSDSDSDSVYEMAMERLVDDEQTIGRGDVGRTGNGFQTTPNNRWRKLSWPGVRRPENRGQMQSRRSGPSRLRTSM